MSKSKTRPFLSRLGKSGKEFAERASANGRELPFADFIALLWQEAVPDDRWAPSFVKLTNGLAELYPKLTSVQIEDMLRLRRVGDRLENAAAARRAVLNDPSELVLGLRAAYRTAFAVRGRWQNNCDMDQLLPMCACGDIEFARRVAQGRRGAYSAIPNPAELIAIATVAWLNDDAETKAIVVAEIEATSMKYVPAWERAMLAAFCAAYHQNADAVAGCIGDLLDRIKKLRDKAGIDLVINLRAHGLYRLFQNESPQLVESFDTTQSFPWDPEVHAWCDDHPAFSEPWDFRAVSKDLHRIVALGDIPRWLPKHPGFFQVELLEADPRNQDLMEVVDGKLSYSEHDPMTIVNACPVVFLYEYEREIAEQTCQRLIAVGGKAKVAKSKPQPYRPIHS